MLLSLLVVSSLFFLFQALTTTCRAYRRSGCHQLCVCMQYRIYVQHRNQQIRKCVHEERERERNVQQMCTHYNRMQIYSIYKCVPKPQIWLAKLHILHIRIYNMYVHVCIYIYIYMYIYVAIYVGESVGQPAPFRVADGLVLGDVLRHILKCGEVAVP